jgi:peptidoglycan/LPS O-acetylase OafA/YrhL
MKSSSGMHFIALDHVRALAAFMVFTWHFTHGHVITGFPIPYSYLPNIFPFAIIDEGHTGVALFMTLSGYLFSKLLNGKKVDFWSFLWNRVLRLLPLLLIVILLLGIKKLFLGEDIQSFIYSIVKGLIFPTLPNGGWSITTEFHYYLILPVFLWMFRFSKFLPFSIILIAITLRLFIHQHTGEVQSLAYWTIIGRVDQFALGMIMFQFRSLVAKNHLFALVTFSLFAMFYWYFDKMGGFMNSPSYPSPSLIWVFLPTIEGFVYALGIAWYETSFSHATTGLSKFIGRIGEYSYSIYLFHFFIVFIAARFVNEHIMDISNFYLSCIWSLICFLLMMPISHLSFRYIEAPFLKLRRSYIIS